MTLAEIINLVLVLGGMLGLGYYQKTRIASLKNVIQTLGESNEELRNRFGDVENYLKILDLQRVKEFYETLLDTEKRTHASKLEDKHLDAQRNLEELTKKNNEEVEKYRTEAAQLSEIARERNRKIEDLFKVIFRAFEFIPNWNREGILLYSGLTPQEQQFIRDNSAAPGIALATLMALAPNPSSLAAKLLEKDLRDDTTTVSPTEEPGHD